jgi:mutator protein MutT
VDVSPENLKTRSHADKTRVVCALLKRGSTLLLARRSPGQALAGWWEFPGGKLEPQETPAQALEREIFEELGWEVSAEHFVGTAEFVWKDRAFLLEAWVVPAPDTGEPEARVHDAFVWLEPQALLDPLGPYLKKTSPADISLLHAYLQLVTNKNNEFSKEKNDAEN